MSEQLTQLQGLLVRLEQWEDTINEALAHGRHTHTFDDVVSMVLQNRVLFFPFDKAFVIMEKVDYPRFSVFHCFLAGGELKEVLAAQDEMEIVGRKLGCKYLSIAGRLGWQRTLRDLGWQHVCTTMYRPIGELSNGQRERRPADFNGHVAARNH